MGIKLKNRNINHPKLQKLLEKSVFIIFIVLIFTSFISYYRLKDTRKKSNTINSIEKANADKKQKVEEFKKYEGTIKDTSWISYDLWLRGCAAVGNLCVYDNTNNLNILSEKSQDELNKLSKDFKIVKENKDYSKVAKFIIIDKNKGTFITNDVDNIEFIRSNLKTFSEENGELFNYVSGKGKWYNITYNSQASPANREYDQHPIANANNYVEAYWFPKDYSYSKEDEALMRNILEVAKNDYNKEIASNEQYILSLKNSITRNKISIAVDMAVILIMLFTIFFLGKENLVRALKENNIVKLVRYIDKWFEERSTLFKIAVFILFTSSAIVLLSFIYRYGFRYIFILWVLFYLLIILPKTIKFCRYIDEIMNGIDKITSGDLEHVIEEKGDSALSRLAFNINKLNKGFKVSIEDQIKNEKLKSELVTNVSHDLKTPLTSIINYTDILLRENISEEEKEEFVKILNRKSLKLKKLIEDLFEISKINSGKVELTTGNVDVVELVDQSIAEYSDTEIYTDKNLTFVIKPFTNKIEMDLDGKKMSTVFENLINNALKYSQKDTRVFVDIEEIGKGIKICFKNLSSIPLDFDKEEIFERFTRGDKSRNSNINGSGLGLAIARSIVELHGGIMYIDFDGDLFKVIIELYY